MLNWSAFLSRVNQGLAESQGRRSGCALEEEVIILRMLDQLHMSALCRCFVFLFRHITNVVTPVNEVTKYLYLLILSVQFQ